MRTSSGGSSSSMGLPSSSSFSGIGRHLVVVVLVVVVVVSPGERGMGEGRWGDRLPLRVCHLHFLYCNGGCCCCWWSWYCCYVVILREGRTAERQRWRSRLSLSSMQYYNQRQSQINGERRSCPWYRDDSICMLLNTENRLNLNSTRYYGLRRTVRAGLIVGIAVVACRQPQQYRVTVATSVPCGSTIGSPTRFSLHL